MSSSGGGIVRLGNSGNSGIDARALRRRWPSGVAIVTTRDGDNLRGATVSSLLIISVEPPIVAATFQSDSGFLGLLASSTPVGISLLHRDQEVLAERFAGRAPVPDGRFTGVPHRLVNNVPLLENATGWATGVVASRQDVGDHVLVLIDLDQIDLAADTDDPMVLYEAGYRSLEP